MIIIDANGICHAAKHSMGSLSWKEKETGVIFGFLNQLLTIAKTMDSNQFLFTWDSVISKRKEIFPDYKKSRRTELKTEDEQRLDEIAYKQFSELQGEILPFLGFTNNFLYDGFEADDLIASIVHNMPRDHFAIISSDEDLYQLLRENVYVYSTKKKQSYTIKNLWTDFKIKPDDWAKVKAIGGCSSDGVPGIPGVGEKTAAKYLNKTLPYTGQAYRKIKENTALIDFNMKLVKLPFEGTPVISKTKPDDLCFENFMKTCKYLGFRSYMNETRMQEWKKYIFHKEA